MIWCRARFPLNVSGVSEMGHWLLPVSLMGLDNVFSSRVACSLPYCNVDPTSVYLLFISVVCTKVFYTTQCTIKFLMFLISTRLRFKWAHAKSQIPHRSHAQWCIDVFVNSVIISVIYKFVSYSSPKHHNIMITSSRYHIVNMVVILTSIWLLCMHRCLLSVLQSGL